MVDGQVAAATAQTFVPSATFWMTIVIFGFSLLLIMTEKVNKAAVAMGGAALMLLLKLVDQHDAFHNEALGADWNVIFLLISMMVLIEVMKPTGIFGYIGVKCAKMGKGDPIKILSILMVATAMLSALLDNVTTVLLLVPVMLFIADALDVSGTPFALGMITASNVGGTATLIGDPPNIMIGSKAGITFLDFLIHITPVVLFMMIIVIPIFMFMFRKELITAGSNKARIMKMNEKERIKDLPAIIKTLSVLTLVLLGFGFHGVLHYEAATIAVSGAVLAALVVRGDVEEYFKEVEWVSIAFFAGLFIQVGAIVKTGAIAALAMQMLELTGGNLFWTAMILLPFAAVMSAVIDNIPFTAVMIPLIISMAGQIPELQGTENLLLHPKLMPIWWALSLGACLGGNGSPIGASANVITLGLMEKAKQKISFFYFMSKMVPVTLLTVAIANLYVWLRYY